MNADIQRFGGSDSRNGSVNWQHRHQRIKIIQPVLELLTGRLQQWFHLQQSCIRQWIAVNLGNEFEKQRHSDEWWLAIRGWPPVPGVNCILGMQLNAQLRMQRISFFLSCRAWESIRWELTRWKWLWIAKVRDNEKLFLRRKKKRFCHSYPNVIH